MKSTPLLLAAFMLAAFMVAACSSAPQWEKSGASDTQVSEDMQQCRVNTGLTPAPRVGSLAPSGTGTPAMDRAEGRDAREAVLFDKCMQDRGYRAKR
jgi:hypothetical protein